ncbi:MAG: hypothetical protein WBX25_34830 [Rhodomicrobium sp.]
MTNPGHFITSIGAWVESDRSEHAHRLEEDHGHILLHTWSISGPPIYCGTREISLAEAKAYQSAFADFERCNKDLITTLEQQEHDRYGVESAERPGLFALFYWSRSLGTDANLCVRLICKSPRHLVYDGPVTGSLDHMKSTYPAAWAKFVDDNAGYDPSLPAPRAAPQPIRGETAASLQFQKPRLNLSMSDEIKLRLAQLEEHRIRAGQRR